MNRLFLKSRLPLATLALIAFIFSGAATPALAGEIEVKLSGSEQVPSVETSASGKATIKVKDDKTIKGSLTTSDMDATKAHIHEGAVGKNGPDIVPMKKTGDSEWSIPQGTKLTDMQYDAYQAGNLYINVHSEKHPAGEIRGQLKNSTH